MVADNAQCINRRKQIAFPHIIFKKDVILESFMHYTQHLLIDTQRYIDIGMHWHSICSIDMHSKLYVLRYIDAHHSIMTSLMLMYVI